MSCVCRQCSGSVDSTSTTRRRLSRVIEMTVDDVPIDIVLHASSGLVLAAERRPSSGRWRRRSCCPRGGWTHDFPIDCEVAGLVDTRQAPQRASCRRLVVGVVQGGPATVAFRPGRRLQAVVNEEAA